MECPNPDCKKDHDQDDVLSCGALICESCGTKVAHDGEALTFVDEFPEDEYLGG
jgi:hypothetical protein